LRLQPVGRDQLTRTIFDPPLRQTAQKRRLAAGATKP
jgi:hypothetical protein